MNDAKLKKFIEDYEKLYSRIYRESDNELFKKNAEKFFELYKEFGGKRINLIMEKGLKQFLKDELLSRIFLGIGCELIVKSIYLKNGYVINEVDKSRLTKNIHFPFLIKDIPKSCIKGERTYDFKKLNNNLYNLRPKNVTSEDFNKHIIKPLEIARIWRNKETHIGGGYHRESGEISEIKYALMNIYNLFFKEKFTSF